MAKRVKTMDDVVEGTVKVKPIIRKTKNGKPIVRKKKIMTIVDGDEVVTKKKRVRRSKNYLAMKRRIIVLLKERSQYISVDEYILNRLIEAMELADMAMDDIRENGVVIELGMNGYKNKNPSISTYRESIKTIMDISKKLGMSVRDRAELGIGIDEPEDEL